MNPTCPVCARPAAADSPSPHGLCPDCLGDGLAEVFDLCLAHRSDDPMQLLEALMRRPGCPMHGPIHHILVGAALLTAYKNAGGDLSLPEALLETARRGRQVPPAACGFWGACGAGIATGQFVSIATGTGPLSTESWGLANRMTAAALERIGSFGGPRCCKRDSSLAVLTAVDFAAEHLGIRMTSRPPVCRRSDRNEQCLKHRCPFHPGSAVAGERADEEGENS
ncbi:MAG: SAM-dependent methyltransferase [Clostridia bacterium]|nr:SAM-dependent methyltransferase [Clostridia bacterium]